MSLSSPPTIPMRPISILMSIGEPIRLAARSVPCVAAMLLADGECEHAERWAEGQPFFVQHLIPAFRPRGASGPRAASAFCSVCASLRIGTGAEIFEPLPWSVDHRGRAMPIDAAGPLSPRQDARDVEAMPVEWTEQVQAITDAFHATAVRQRREPTARVEQLIDAVAERIGCTIPAGVFLSGAVAYGCGFGIARDDHPKLMIDTRDLTPLVDAICERFSLSNG